MPVTIATFAISGMVNANLPVPQPTSNHPVTVLKTTKSDQQRCKSAAPAPETMLPNPGEIRAKARPARETHMAAKPIDVTKLSATELKDLLANAERHNQTAMVHAVLAAEQMAKTGGGSIVNISSIMGFVGGASGHPAYSASKGAVRIYTKSAAVRYGPLGIRVDSVHPGYMPPMLNATNANERADKIALTPLRRLGEPIEVAYGVLFLASDEASFVTGAELVIDGGYIAQ